jgi:penicillin amidase
MHRAQYEDARKLFAMSQAASSAHAEPTVPGGSAPLPRQNRSLGRRLVRLLLVLPCLVALTAAWGAYWLRGQLQGSLPQLSGNLTLDGLRARVVIERDAQGIPTIRARNRDDLAFATGFLHGQERFFQMDLLRRNSAGELAELIGPPLVEQDREVRLHRFRDVARRIVAAGSPDERALGEAYARGVNAGLAALKTKPFEYLLMGASPAPWTVEDTVLVLFSMYLDLQGKDYLDEAARGLLNDLLPEPMYAFLAPRGTEWDAPLDGPAFEVPPIPGPEVMDLRKQPLAASPEQRSRRARPDGKPALAIFSWHDRDRHDAAHPGSNNWAVAGSHTRHGGAIVADDMHLGIDVPNIWYRARFRWSDASGRQHDVTGVTLPGAPAMVVGSNGHVAWAFTNSEGDWADLVLLEPVAGDPDAYLTPDGPRKFERHVETIKVAGAPSQTLIVRSTIWGPVIDKDHRGRQRALRWVAHDPEGVNLQMFHLESAQTLEEAMRMANLSGSPAQNFTVADNQGHIGWTILGRIPRRVGFDGRLPTSWADGKHRWQGWLDPEEYPRIIDPPSGRIWTANARVVSGRQYETLGDGGYDLGARASQIRDDLLALDKADENDMLKIQLDDRALFWDRWQKLLLAVLTRPALAADPRREEFRDHVRNWGGRAATGSVGFRLVRLFRAKTIDAIFEPLTAPCRAVDPDFRLARLEFCEGPAWRLVSQKPAHLLNPKYKTWDEQLLAVVDEIITEATADHASLADYTWGAFNTTRIQHPLSKAVPALGRWLDMPAQPLPGGSSDMPRIQGPTFGASQRLAVSPGRESDGYFHMPGGQSGHPLSPHYRDGHEAWARGLKTPFLPGKTVNTLVLSPTG